MLFITGTSSNHYLQSGMIMTVGCVTMIKHSKYPRANIYLSGAMQFAGDGKLGGTWRERVSRELKSMEYFPLDITDMDIAYTEQHGDLYHSFASEPEYHLQMKSNLRKHFVFTDLKLIEKDSDALVLLYDEGVRKGAGTISEAQHAYNLDIPIFIVSAYDNWHTEIPGWLLSLSTKVFDNFNELYEYLEMLPYGILKRDAYGNHNAGNMYLCSLCGDPFKKNKHHFVSTVSPMYCVSCVDIVTTTFEDHKDRYQFFIEYLENEST